MRAVLILFCLTWALSLSGQDVGHSDSPGSSKSYPRLITKKGQTYHDVVVKRVEPDALIISHRGGVARISFFDVEKEIQTDFDFDPVAALDKYKKDRAVQRQDRWKRFWEHQKNMAAVAERKDRQLFLQKVKTNWIPVEATVHLKNDDGAFVQASRIKMVPTKTKSTLGFEIDGPPRKTLVPMEPSVIFIKAADISGKKWLGYLEPIADGTVKHPTFNGHDIPTHRAVALTEIK